MWRRILLLGQGWQHSCTQKLLPRGKEEMHLRNHIRDHLLVQQLSCYPGASTVQLALTVGGCGTSSALPGPAAGTISKTPREKQIHSRKIHWRLLGVGRPPQAWEVFEVQAAGGCSVLQGHHHSLAWSQLLHQHVTGDSRGQ